MTGTQGTGQPAQIPGEHIEDRLQETLRSVAAAMAAGMAAHDRWQAHLRRRFPGIAPIAWEELDGEEQADWIDVGRHAVDARVAAIVKAAAGDTVIVAFKDAVTAHEAEEMLDRWREYGPEDPSLVIVEDVAGIAVAASAELSKHRTRLAMLLADTPFEFRPDWAAEYDDAAPQDGLVPAPEPEDETPGYWQARAALTAAVHALVMIAAWEHADLAVMARDTLGKVDAIMGRGAGPADVPATGGHCPGCGCPDCCADACDEQDASGPVYGGEA